MGSDFFFESIKMTIVVIDSAKKHANWTAGKSLFDDWHPNCIFDSFVQLVYGSVTVIVEFNKTQVPFTIEKIENYFNDMQIVILTNEILAAVQKRPILL